MRSRTRRNNVPDELALAIGLVWGHLNAFQYEEAYELAQGCLQIWPDEPRLVLMGAYAAVEMLEPLDPHTMAILESAECRDWVKLILTRAACSAQSEVR